MEPLLTTAEVAEQLRTSSSQVRELVRAGLLSAVNIATGKKRMAMRFQQSEVDDFIRRQTTMQLPPESLPKSPRRREQIASYQPLELLERAARGEL